MDLCRNPHPDNQQIWCDKTGSHEFCSGFDRGDLESCYVDWANPDFVRPAQTSEGDADAVLKRVAERMRQRWG